MTSETCSLSSLHYVSCRARAKYEPQSFGDYYGILSGPNGFVRLIRDRSKYCVDGEQKDLEPVGLWGAFDNREEFTMKVLSWLKNTVT
jgi:hypothetical protein